ncbi:AIPR family protein [Ruminococcus sp. NK3A76]|uniref:AIPR family protein n=1 Tax=Ruminococcus sp. NK3A76 TaxID=877411 RepID=UPI00048D78C5|nr:AIPR family protein [Ruminococcus sp. NK3A76]
MSNIIDDRMNRYYEEFKEQGDLNTNCIVRRGKKEDAFPIVVLEILYRNLLDKPINSSHANYSKPEAYKEISKYIVPPPDSGIDMIIEKENGDEYEYEFVQVKHSSLRNETIYSCFDKMKSTIKAYLNNPDTVKPPITKSFLNLINEKNFDKSFEKNVTYVVVHNGDNSSYVSRDFYDEIVITSQDLERILNNNELECVHSAVLKSDAINNFMTYQDNALLVNIRGWELANLALEYDNTETGKNLLYGQNFRNGLDKKSKTYAGMKETIDSEPHNFWYYNNGITIVAKDYDAKKDDNGSIDSIILTDFSIINGAQTTSSLCKYYLEADDKDKAKQRLNNVYVFTRILKITDEKLGLSITKFNNTQNPISDRDMVSNNIEQISLQRKLKEGAPRIYMEIRNGEKKYLTGNTRLKKAEKHRYISNEDLAQLVHAGLKQSPYTAKDQKKQLFIKDLKRPDLIINQYYDDVFSYISNPQGILFTKSNNEIDELLFVGKELYDASKKQLKEDYGIILKSSTDDTEKEEIKLQLQISRICKFYVLCYYYSAKVLLETRENKSYSISYDSDRYFDNQEYKKALVEGFTTLFLIPTIEIIIEEKSKTPNSASDYLKTLEAQRAFLSLCNRRIAIRTTISKIREYFESIL